MVVNSDWPLTRKSSIANIGYDYLQLAKAGLRRVEYDSVSNEDTNS